MNNLTKYIASNVLDFKWGKEVNQLEIQATEMSDGYHTMNELYEHRIALFAALCKLYDGYITPLNTRVKCWKSKFHHDGTSFEGWFIAGMLIREFDGTDSQISYHIPNRLWNRFNVMELRKGPIWDGHTSKDVIERLYKL